MFGSEVDIEQAFGHAVPMRRTYVRRRLVALALLLTVLAIGAPAAARVVHADQGPATATYVVQPGDTLWSIAGRVAPDEDPRAVVDAIGAANDLPGSGLVPGQALQVPAA